MILRRFNLQRSRVSGYACFEDKRLSNEVGGMTTLYSFPHCVRKPFGRHSRDEGAGRENQKTRKRDNQINRNRDNRKNVEQTHEKYKKFL